MKKKKKPDVEKVITTERKCLKCGKTFKSTHAGHRLCATCNTENKSVRNIEIRLGR